MGEPVTLQAILGRFLNREGLDPHRQRVCDHLQACRTEALGGRRLACTACGREQLWYHGCRDRHCPQCQGRATRQWAERRQGDILPVPYFHLVFTLPHTLNGWVQLHPEVLYRRLFEAAWATLQAFGRDPKRLNGQIGMSAVLHTWGQNLSQHVHLHCLVPGGALGGDGQWRRSKGNYLFPVKALSRHFRGGMVRALRQSATEGQLHRVRPGEIDAVLDHVMDEPWLVYSKACLQHTETVVAYLARYTHRIAITHHRLQALDEHGVSLRYKDYRDRGRQKMLRLEGHEFVRRFLLHILPKGLMRVRHFGFLANGCRRERLRQIRGVLAVQVPLSTPKAADPVPERVPRDRCPVCRTGMLLVVAELRAHAAITGKERWRN